MKTIDFRTLLLGIFFMFSVGAYAQDDSQSGEAQEEAPGNLTEEFVLLKKKSNPYKGYRVVKETRLDEFWINVKDSLATFQSQLNETQAKVDAQNQEVQELQNTVQAKDKTIQESQHASTHISVMGMEIMKDSFVTFFWSAVSVLVLLLGLAIYQYKRSEQVTGKTRRDYRTLQHELEEFRKSALERERKLRRELQTERNLVEELRTTSGQKDKTRFY